MPAADTAASKIATQVREIVASHETLEGPLLPVLHAVQEVFGHVPAEALPVIAAELNLSRAEVHGVMSFYHDFRDAPAGRHVLKLCRAEACQAMGADALADRARERLGVDWHGTTRDGAVTLEPVFCLGLCACGPAAMLDGRPVGRVDAARLDELLEGAR
ncbi:MAG: formate dehydrogenase subunit gamma [Gemmobacter sp.]